MTERESSSMEKCLSFKETANEAANRAARASPKFGSHEGLICEMSLMIVPLESLQTAAWAEKLSRMAVSKLILKEPLSGGDQTSTTLLVLEDQAAWWARAVFLMEEARKVISGMVPLWRALFLLSQRRSQRTIA